ncbi:MAG TPA: translation elongation factor Ts [Tissierellia bacterium]|nr:translation elongation factor Ts [Tissierellia bacterium]
MAVAVADIKKLREMTGAGMMDAKKALEEHDGNMDAAIKYLREKGLAQQAKRSSRIASEGIIASYVHGGRIGVLVEVNSETDFVAKNADFQEFAKDMAMQIAASNPLFVSVDEVPEDQIANEKDILRQQALNEGKPENIVDKMVEGRIRKYFEEVVLLEQAFIKDPDKKVKHLLEDINFKIGEKISIRRFVRYELGEGMEKRAEDFAAEVAAQMK